jgi:hypothetical protein
MQKLIKKYQIPKTKMKIKGEWLWTIFQFKQHN